MTLIFHDCGLSYLSDGWIETRIPNETWNIITAEDDASLLCVTCINKRCTRQGLTDVPVEFIGVEALRTVTYNGE